jgi:transcriptional regulator with XRE-family HTH domain
MQPVFNHSLCVSATRGVCDNLQMDDQDKNGGPNYLREWRTFRGMTQQQLAEAVETNANMIQYLEKGERALSAKWLRRLAPILDTTPGMILDHDPHNLDRDILEIWATASNREKRQITDIAKAILRTGTD